MQPAESRSTLVALLAEGVDRNKNVDELRNGCPVALLAEGVDRNLILGRRNLDDGVALLAEGVDRNTFSRQNPGVPP